MRPGEETVVFLTFKGCHPHSGTSPSLHEKHPSLSSDDIEGILQNAEWRVAYILYPNFHTVNRIGDVAVSPPLNFGPPPRSLHDSQITLADDDARVVFGTLKHFHNWHAREQVACSFNWKIEAGAIPSDPNDTLALYRYKDENGDVQSADPLVVNPIHDLVQIEERRQWWSWMESMVRHWDMQITNRHLQDARDARSSTSKSTLSLSGPRRFVLQAPSILPTPPQAQISDVEHPEPIIDEVIRITHRNSVRVFCFVILQIRFVESFHACIATYSNRSTCWKCQRRIYFLECGVASI